MKILLVVSSANDVFIYNLAKWLKQSMECTIDAFELYPSVTANQEDSSGLLETVVTADRSCWWWNNTMTRFVFSPLKFAKQLDEFVSNKHYDVIHIQGVWAYLPLTNNLRAHTDKLFVSFWGIEHIKGEVWHSHLIYDYRLKRFIKTIDGITGALARLKVMKELFPETPLYESRFGMASLDTIVNLNNSQKKEESKRYWGMPPDKISLLIGYSGKRLHNHLDIIKALKNYPDFYNRVHLLAPMTRGASSDYVKEVEKALTQSGYSYTLLKDRFLTDEEIGILRHSTDVVFQFADSDAYSRSIIESICAGAILIYGNWIKYNDLLADDGFEAFETDSIQGGIKILNDYVISPEKYMLIGKKNVSSGCKQYQWSECIKDFVGIYTGEKNAEVF